MKRREFVSSLLRNKNQNINSNEGIQIDGDLKEYSGEWNSTIASHVLRRTLFGFRKSDLNKALSFSNLSQCVDELIKVDNFQDDPPIKFFDNGQYNDTVSVGETWINAPFNPALENERMISLKAWWFGKILNQRFNIQEKMCLFWHNHFATESEVVRVGIYQHQTYELFRKHAVGNFKSLVEKISIDPTMALYLNLNENIVGRPNENYARELFELFTLGKGPLIGEGNYTYFTENDIREAAKVLTGWNLRIRGTDIEKELKFYPTLHDFTIKNFSEAFNNASIQPSTENEYKELINMIFDHDQASKHIIRKLYRWFVYYKIDDNIEKNIIEPLSIIFKENNFEISVVLKKLLKSEHFVNSIGVQIKNPLDYTIGLIKNLESNMPTRNNPLLEEYTNNYIAWFYYGLGTLVDQQLDLFDPPSVAGWEAYYQQPSYYRIWVSSATIQVRHSYFNTMFSARGFNRNAVQFKPSAIQFAESLDNPSDPVKLIDEMCERFFPINLTSKQKERLKSNLVDDGQGDYNWTDLWITYQTNRNDQVTVATVESKLTNLLKAAFELAEYQLS